MALERKVFTERIIGAAIEVQRNNPGTEARECCLSESVPAFLPSLFTTRKGPTAQQLQDPLGIGQT
jgi:hypothetical protein